MAKKTGTMAKVGKSLKAAAGAVADAAGTYVVEPVGEALGLVKPAKKPRAKRAAKKTAAGRTLTGNVAKALPKAGAKRTAKKCPGPKSHKRHPTPVSASRPPRRP